MKAGKFSFAVPVLLICVTMFFSCAEKKEKQVEEKPEAEKTTLSYISDEISFGLFFDKEGTKRTITLEKGQKTFEGFVYVQVPDNMEIVAVQWRLEMPAGVKIDVDRFHEDRIMTLGQIRHGISERFKPCLNGPKILIHSLTFVTFEKLENAVFSILPAEDADYLAIATCQDGYPEERASSYRAVVNPVD